MTCPNQHKYIIKHYPRNVPDPTPLCSACHEKDLHLYSHYLQCDHASSSCSSKYLCLACFHIRQGELSLKEQKLKEGLCTHALEYFNEENLKRYTREAKKCMHFDDGCYTYDVDGEDCRYHKWYCKKCKHVICLRCLVDEKLPENTYMVEMYDSDLN